MTTEPFKHCFPNLYLFLSHDVLFGCVWLPDGGCIVYPGWGDAVQKRKRLVKLHEQMQKNWDVVWLLSWAANQTSCSGSFTWLRVCKLSGAEEPNMLFVSPCVQWWAISKLPHTLTSFISSRSLGSRFDATGTALHNRQNAIHGQQHFAAPPLCRPSSQGKYKTDKSTSEAGKPVPKYKYHSRCFMDVVNWF